MNKYRQKKRGGSQSEPASKILMGVLTTHNPWTSPFSPTVHKDDQSKCW